MQNFEKEAILNDMHSLKAAYTTYLSNVGIIELPVLIDTPCSSTADIESGMSTIVMESIPNAKVIGIGDEPIYICLRKKYPSIISPMHVNMYTTQCSIDLNYSFGYKQYAREFFKITVSSEEKIKLGELKKHESCSTDFFLSNLMILSNTLNLNKETTREELRLHLGKMKSLNKDINKHIQDNKLQAYAFDRTYVMYFPAITLKISIKKANFILYKSALKKSLVPLNRGQHRKYFSAVAWQLNDMINLWPSWARKLVSENFFFLGKFARAQFFDEIYEGVQKELKSGVSTKKEALAMRHSNLFNIQGFMNTILSEETIRKDKEKLSWIPERAKLVERALGAENIFIPCLEKSESNCTNELTRMFSNAKLV